MSFQLAVLSGFWESFRLTPLMLSFSYAAPGVPQSKITPCSFQSAQSWSQPHPFPRHYLHSHHLISILHTSILLSQPMPEPLSHRSISHFLRSLLLLPIPWGASRKESKGLVMNSALDCKRLKKNLECRVPNNLHLRWVGLRAAAD